MRRIMVCFKRSVPPIYYAFFLFSGEGHHALDFCDEENPKSMSKALVGRKAAEANKPHVRDDTGAGLG